MKMNDNELRVLKPDDVQRILADEFPGANLRPYVVIFNAICRRHRIIITQATLGSYLGMSRAETLPIDG